ncbi:rhomboid family intramembrane serine protease [Fertoebacter nigrum]|uniref:Rhomboid family intramembrane serine protease n=1 Tax=Fertoeibacter niger TaxID=2656921 RepID=A0A8X8KL07_9RHOB|nr:rhomboid family intramembrane serine protease [Fertoeibacter niger]NUB44809.1 rhomboid family intramembrane serine protease [Fertoeibacter niger]
MLRYVPLAVIVLACIGLHEGLSAMEGWSREWRKLAWTIAGGGKFWVVLLAEGEEIYPMQRVLMFWTHGFVHVSRAHLWVNLLFLVPLGAYAIRSVGPWRFLALYLAGMPLAALGYALLVDDPYATMLGASGGIYVLGGAALVWLWQDTRAIAAPLLWLAVMLATNALFWWLTAGKFAWELHLAGVVVGLAMAPLLRRT